MTANGLSAEQAAVFAGHKQQFMYHMNAVDGLHTAYRCRSLGLVRVVVLPKRKPRDLVSPTPQTHWFLGDDGITYRSLAEVADVILYRRRQLAVSALSRCEQSPLAASVSECPVG